MRMNGGRYLKIVLLGGLHSIRVKRKAQKTLDRQHKEDCGTLGVTVTQAPRTAQDRNNWKTTINGLPMQA